MEIKPVYLFIVAFIVITLGIVVIQESANNAEAIDTSSDTSTQNETYISTISLSPIDEGITSYQVSRINDTWLDCDGINDYAYLPSTENDTISFWYNSSTSTDWVFVVSVFNVKYTNGVLSEPIEYPIYYNNTGYILCKIDDSTFWEGSIDELRIYDGQLNSTQINDLLALGR